MILSVVLIPLVRLIIALPILPVTGPKSPDGEAGWGRVYTFTAPGGAHTQSAPIQRLTCASIVNLTIDQILAPGLPLY